MNEKAKLDLILIAVVYIFISLASTGLYHFTLGTGKLPSQMVRLLIEVLLLVSLYRERQWARWILIVLSALGGIFGLYSLFGNLANFNLAFLFLGCTSVFYLFIAVYLGFIRKWDRPVL
jgi:hypothetical protein